MLCKNDNCRKLYKHTGNCDPYPASAWGFLDAIDKKKITKAGFATPRGGSKGAYQNHVSRSNQVILPYEKVKLLSDEVVNKFKHGFVIRLFPHQIFNEDLTKKKLGDIGGEKILIGKNAFVLYRSHQDYEKYPPLSNWEVRRMLDGNGEETQKRSQEVTDIGDYVLRLPALAGGNAKKKKIAINEGPVQGIFAPEYASYEINYLSKAILAWQIVHSVDSPFTSNQAKHLKCIIDDIKDDISDYYDFHGILKGSFLTCPLCLSNINYTEIHEKINLDGEDSLQNAGEQVDGATRSTEINLFHMMPLGYKDLYHLPLLVSWGHATCNTKLGQRKCWSLGELKEQNIKVAKIINENISSFGWISEDEKMIRSPLGSVWIQISTDLGQV